MNFAHHTFVFLQLNPGESPTKLATIDFVPAHTPYFPAVGEEVSVDLGEEIARGHVEERGSAFSDDGGSMVFFFLSVTSKQPKNR